MTAIISSAATLVASTVPAFFLSPGNPAAILGFLVVGACLLLAAREYGKPARVTRHGLRH